MQFVVVLIISNILSTPKISAKPSNGILAETKTTTNKSDGPGTPAVPIAPNTEVIIIKM